MQYQLIDSGEGKKLEQFGSIVLIRPCAQAIWKCSLPKKEWDLAHAEFIRLPEAKWIVKKRLPTNWKIEIEGLKFNIEPTSFGHLGIFPEHSLLWPDIKEQITLGLKESKEFSVLNLFAYSGAATLFSAKCGAEVCHLDASKSMVEEARNNAKLNHMEDRPIRWIIDDVFKFLKREIKRGRQYDGIILDPPSFGRGAKGEVFKIENDFIELLSLVKELLSEKAKFVITTCHTPGISAVALKNLCASIFDGGAILANELLIPHKTNPLPKGIYAKWTR